MLSCPPCCSPCARRRSRGPRAPNGLKTAQFPDFSPQRTQRTQRRMRKGGVRTEIRRTLSFPGSRTFAGREDEVHRTESASEKEPANSPRSEPNPSPSGSVSSVSSVVHPFAGWSALVAADSPLCVLCGDVCPPRTRTPVRGSVRPLAAPWARRELFRRGPWFSREKVGTKWRLGCPLHPSPPDRVETYARDQRSCPSP
jgi:hypothetical protein